MNKFKLKLLEMIIENKINSEMSLRAMAKLIGADNKPQIVKFHLSSLILAGFVKIRPNGGYKATPDAFKFNDFLKANVSLFRKIERLYSK